MKWFKHESAANMDAKLQEVLLDYGLEGYGLYWYCLELIAGNVAPNNLTFELEHDARLIARNTGSTRQKIEEMMARFVELGLFENAQGVVSCLKLAARTDEYTAKLVKKSRHSPDNVPTLSRQNPEKSVLLEEKRREENRTEQKNITPPDDGVPDCPHQEIIKAYHDHCPTLARVRIWNDDRKKILRSRWREDTDRQNLDWWVRYFKYAHECDYLIGKINGFQADLEWLVRPSNMVKVIEGKYENREAQA